MVCGMRNAHWSPWAVPNMAIAKQSTQTKWMVFMGKYIDIYYLCVFKLSKWENHRTINGGFRKQAMYHCQRVYNPKNRTGTSCQNSARDWMQVILIMAKETSRQLSS